MKEQKIDECLQDCVSLNNQINGLTTLLNKKKEVVQNYMKENGEKQVKSEGVTVYTQEKVKVEYNIPKIQQLISKKLYSKFLRKTAEITDAETFLKICKTNNIDLSLFKDVLDVGLTVDERRLSSLYDQGEITLKDLEGAYESQVTKSVAFRFKQCEPTFKTSE